MKKIIIVISAALVLFSSCRVNVEVEINKDIAYKGLRIYGAVTDNGISKYLLGLDNMLKGEEVVNAPLEKKDSLEDFYFPDYKVRSDADSIYLKPFAVISKENEIPFTQPGSIRYYKMEGFTMMAECVNDNEYVLTPVPAPGQTSTSTSLNVTVYPNDVFGQNTYNSVYSYAVLGKGEYNEVVDGYSSGYYSSYLDYSSSYDYLITYTAQYDIQQPLLAYLTPNVFSISYGAFKYYGGGIKMLVTGTSLGNGTDLVTATLRTSSDHVVATIDYNGDIGEFTL